MKKPLIYIGCSLNGAPQPFVREVTKLKQSLKKDYDLLEFVGLNYKSVKQVYEWDIEHCVKDCDLFVAICDERSTGLGWELCEAVHLGKPVLAVSHKEANISGIVLGAAELKDNFKFARYTNLHRDIPKMISEHFIKLKV